MQPNKIVSEFDKQAYLLIRDNIFSFLSETSKEFDKDGKLILEVAPQVHSDVSKLYQNATIETLDIDPNSSATYIADLTQINNKIIENKRFDVVICMEVLEHTLNPFKAMNELYRVLKNGGVLLLSTPYNFRIHGPLPDCWRFTRYGLYALLEDAGFQHDNIIINELDTNERDLMLIHYTVIAKK